VGQKRERKKSWEEVSELRLKIRFIQGTKTNLLATKFKITLLGLDKIWEKA
jgi:hypothetical protein